jgi:hypothetical protein
MVPLLLSPLPPKAGRGSWRGIPPAIHGARTQPAHPCAAVRRGEAMLRLFPRHPLPPKAGRGSWRGCPDAEGSFFIHSRPRYNKPRSANDTISPSPTTK